MADNAYRYDAFISYRHIKTDMLVAERLQQLLERHCKKDGNKLRVFRDRSELPTSSDLGQDIRTALDHSRFLIVICSPEYEKSQWCMAELNYFRSIHGESNSRILPILVEGEPQDVFPEQLLWEQETVTLPDGTQETFRRQVEPLGADVRAENDHQRLKLLKTEHLRIAAPLLGCGFDDLFQRDQRRRKNRILAAAGAVAALAVAFSLYSAYMVRQISLRQAQLEQTQRELYANESRRLANDALMLVGEDPALAMLLADIALPEDLDNPERPLEKGAELALGNAVLNTQIRRASSIIEPKDAVTLKSSTARFRGFVDDGKKLVFSDGDYVWLYDGDSLSLIDTIPADGNFMTFNRDGSAYCADVTRTYLNRDGQHTITVQVYDTATDTLCGTFSMEFEWESEATYASTDVAYYPALDRFYVMLHYDYYSEDDRVFGWIDSSGKTGAADTLPDGEYWEELTAAHVPNPGDPQVRAMLRDCYGEETVISCTNDGRIYFVYGAYDSFGNPRNKTILWDAREKMELGTLTDHCFQGSCDGIFYSQIPAMEDCLQSYTYNLERIGQTVEDSQLLQCISEGGDRGLYEEEVHRQHHRMTPDFRYLLRWDNNKKLLQLQETDSGKVVFSLERDFVGAYCVDAEGKRVAVAFEDILSRQDNEWVIEVYDVETRERTHSLRIPDCAVFSGEETGYTIRDTAVMELSGESLSLSFTNMTYLIDLNRPQEFIAVEGRKSSQCYTYKIPADRIFQDDGLLIVPGDNGSYWDYLYQINLIYDRNQNRTVSFDIPSDDYSGFCYDAVTGSLIIGDHGVISVQRREEGGDFREIYRIVAKDSTARLDTALPACDGKYLVLNGDTQSEIYDISDGTLLYTVTHTGNHTSHFCVIDSTLYDAAGKVHATGEIPRYELLDTAGWRALAGEYLTEDGVTRTLSDAECEEYYIPTEWRKAQ